jgi:hypothetical protein
MRTVIIRWHWDNHNSIHSGLPALIISNVYRRHSYRLAKNINVYAGFLASPRKVVYNKAVSAFRDRLNEGAPSKMERRPASHTEEEEMNQRRKLLSLARKGDSKAISRLFELYQVRVYSGNTLHKAKHLPTIMVHEKQKKSTSQKAVSKRGTRPSTHRAVRKAARKAIRKHK